MTSAEDLAHGWRAPALAAAASVAISTVYAVLGTGYVLDDWFTLRYAHFDGMWAASGPDQRFARPGAALVYALVFGSGQHPLVTLAIQAVIGAATAALLVVALRRFFPGGIAFVAALLWVWLPNHTSLEVWASATNIAVCVLLAVAATVLLCSPRRGVQVLSVVLFAASALCYEAIIPLAAVLIVVVPWRLRGRPDPRLVVGGAVVLGLVAAWIVLHWHPAKQVSSGFADLSQALGAHFGWGIAPAGPGASVVLLVALGGVGIALARLMLPSLRPRSGPPEQAVAVGLVVIVLGIVPFAKYLYAPLGAGDRFNFVSAIGGALVWAGLLAMAWAWRRPFAVAAATLLLVVAGVSRWQRAVLWQRAGHDALAIQRGVLVAIPDPGSATVVIGPAPIQEQNIAAYLDQSNVQGALALAYGRRDQAAGLAFDEAQFDQVPAALRFDIRAVSQLQPDTVVEGG